MINLVEWLAEVCDISQNEILLALQISASKMISTLDWKGSLVRYEKDVTSFFIWESKFPVKLFEDDYTDIYIEREKNSIYITTISSFVWFQLKRVFMILRKPLQEDRHFVNNYESWLERYEKSFILEFIHPVANTKIVEVIKFRDIVEYLSSCEWYYGEVTDSMLKSFVESYIEAILINQGIKVNWEDIKSIEYTLKWV